MANFIYNTGKYNLISGSTPGIDVTVDTIQIMLLKTSYIADPDHNFVSDVVANEIVATNYVRNTLANFTITEDDTNDRVNIDCDDSTWTALGGAVNDTIGSAVVYRLVTNDADSILMGFYDSVTGTPTFPFPTNGSDFTLQIADLIRLLHKLNP